METLLAACFACALSNRTNVSVFITLAALSSLQAPRRESATEFANNAHVESPFWLPFLLLPLAPGISKSRSGNSPRACASATLPSERAIAIER